MSTASEVVTAVGAAVGEHGWPALVLLFLAMLARTKPAHDLAWVVGTEIRWRYLRWHGLSDDDCRAMLLLREQERNGATPPSSS